MSLFKTALAALLLTASSAAAEVKPGIVFISISPEELSEALQGAGSTLAIDTTEGDTTLEGRVSGLSTSIYFYDCDGAGFTAPAEPDSQCLGYEYRAYFSGYPQDDATLNAFNAEYHYGELFRDADDDLALQFQVRVEGGVTLEHLLTSYQWWREILEDFEQFMSER